MKKITVDNKTTLEIWDKYRCRCCYNISTVPAKKKNIVIFFWLLFWWEVKFKLVHIVRSKVKWNNHVYRRGSITWNYLSIVTIIINTNNNNAIMIVHNTGISLRKWWDYIAGQPHCLLMFQYFIDWLCFKRQYLQLKETSDRFLSCITFYNSVPLETQK